MSSTITTITWAIPLDYDEFIPACRAYAKIRPQIKQLLASKSLGDTQIAQLPQELIDEIGKNIFDNALKAEKGEWDDLVRCWHGSCYRYHHLGEAKEDTLRDIADSTESYLDETCSAFMYDVVEQHLASGMYDEDAFCDDHWEKVHEYSRYVPTMHHDELDVEQSASCLTTIQVFAQV